MKADKRTLFSADEETFQALDELAVLKNTTRNSLLKEAARKYVIAELKKVIKESAEYQAIMNDAKKALRSFKDGDK